MLFRSSWTGAQTRALREIFEEMTSPRRMNRLLQGDVGAGKTVVALFAMLLALEADYQAALMAPTEILAEQHSETLTGLLEPVGVEVALLTGRLGAAERRSLLAGLSSGETRIVVAHTRSSRRASPSPAWASSWSMSNTASASGSAWPSASNAPIRRPGDVRYAHSQVSGHDDLRRPRPQRPRRGPAGPSSDTDAALCSRRHAPTSIAS